MEQTEIERKWLLDGFPALPKRREDYTEQAYLCFEPVTVRVRKESPAEGGADKFVLTVKGQGTLCRTEVETPLTAAQYAALLPLAQTPAARKLRRFYHLPGGETLEVNLVDEGEPTSFYYAEVEFADVAAAHAFTPPAFLGREVTEEPGHTMGDYCRRKASLAAGAGQ